MSFYPLFSLFCSPFPLLFLAATSFLCKEGCQSTVLPKDPAFARLQMMSETLQTKSETLHMMCNGDYILFFLSASVCCLTLFASWFVNAESAQQMSWLLQDRKRSQRTSTYCPVLQSLSTLKKSPDFFFFCALTPRLHILCMVVMGCCRSFMGSRISLVDDVEEGIIERQAKERQFRSRNQSVMSGLAYCISSSSMILLNKLLLSGYGLTGGISLMFYQVWSPPPGLACWPRSWRCTCFWVVLVLESWNWKQEVVDV